MITRELALGLARAGLRWTPANGDRFVVPDRDMDDLEFVLSDMTIDVLELPSGGLIRFNGTVEWALDSIESDQVIWIPREDQLRTALGEAFVRLEQVPHGYAVTVLRNDEEERHLDIDAERAYARALLAFLSRRSRS